jgi:hypothetical protein
MPNAGSNGVFAGKPLPKTCLGWWRWRSALALALVAFFYGVFELPSPRNAQNQNLNKKIEKKSVLGFCVDCFAKAFRHSRWLFSRAPGGRSKVCDEEVVHDPPMRK